MILRSPDPLADFHRHEDECAEWESKTPICAICGEHITDDQYRYIGNEFFHDSCIGTGNTDTYVECGHIYR